MLQTTSLALVKGATRTRSTTLSYFDIILLNSTFKVEAKIYSQHILQLQTNKDTRLKLVGKSREEAKDL